MRALIASLIILSPLSDVSAQDCQEGELSCGSFCLPAAACADDAELGPFGEGMVLPLSIAGALRAAHPNLAYLRLSSDGRLVVRESNEGPIPPLAAPLAPGATAVFDLLGRGSGAGSTFVTSCGCDRAVPVLRWVEAGPIVEPTALELRLRSLDPETGAPRLVLGARFTCGAWVTHEGPADIGVRARAEIEGGGEAEVLTHLDANGVLDCDAQQAFSATFMLPSGEDYDFDGRVGADDNCPCDWNPDQGNADEASLDPYGDPCDRDRDDDLVFERSDGCYPPLWNDEHCAREWADPLGGECTVTDNCPDHPNAGQRDADGDGRGDACDDDDGDTILDVEDNCPRVFNRSQADLDADGIGDACDADADADRVVDVVDNCPGHANPSQRDTDGDGEGDACDGDDDGDGIKDAVDVCPYARNLQASKDCDDDADGDGTPDDMDPCPFAARPPVIGPGRPRGPLPFEPPIMVSVTRSRIRQVDPARVSPGAEPAGVAYINARERRVCEDDDDHDGITDICDIDCQWSNAGRPPGPCMGQPTADDACCIGTAAAAWSRDPVAFDQLCLATGQVFASLLRHFGLLPRGVRGGER